MRHIRSLAACALALAMALTLTGCGEDERHDAQIFSMDTVMGLTAYGPNGEAGISAAEGVINALDAMLDPELSTSTTYAVSYTHLTLPTN